MAEPQTTEQTAQQDPLVSWWAGKKAPKSQLSDQLEASLYVTEADLKGATPDEGAPAEERATLVLEPSPKPTPEPARKRRSDAGIAKGPKVVAPAAPAGAINAEQKARVLMCVGLVQQTTLERIQAQHLLDEKTRAMNQAQDDLAACLNALSVPALKS